MTETIKSSNKNKMNIWVKSLIVIVIFTTWIWGTYLLSTKVLNKQTDYGYEVYRARTELKYEGLKDSLVTQVDKYIQTVAPGSVVNGITIVELCDKYNINIKFVLAQGHLESHFSTKGIASKTNSIFNVYSYDGLSAEQIINKGHGYSHPDHSIEPYLKLLSSRYLVNKTEEDMFNGFVDVDGNRYATDKKYEDKLLSIYKSIDSIADLSIYKDYHKYQAILGIK